MPVTEWLFDAVLGAMVLGLAIASLHARTLYGAIVLFITLGLLLSLTWARLGAPDLALAEAAIGAGLTGTLLFAALGHSGETSHSPLAPRRKLPALFFALLVLALLMQALWPLPYGPVVVPQLVQESLPASGVGHPVTAVLLNFRAWDTLLELMVLLLALLGVRQLPATGTATPAPWPQLLAWSRILAPLTVLLGGYLLWRGTAAPGGAFQAGTLLAAGAVMLRLSGVLPPLRWTFWPIRWLVLMGAGLFLSVATLTAWLGSAWLHYPQPWSAPLIVAIEVAATLSIATTLALLVVGEKEELGSGAANQ